MKIKEGFVIREAAGSFVVMKLGGEADFRRMITINETGKFIWSAIDDGFDENEIAEKLCEEYEIDFDTALKDVNAFIKKMKEADVIE